MRSWSLEVDVKEPLADVFVEAGSYDEGSPVPFTMAGTQDHGFISLYEYDCYNAGEYGPNDGEEGQCVYPDQGEYTIGVRVTDNGASVGTPGPFQDVDGTLVQVVNVAPVITTLPNTHAVPHQSYRYDFTAFDPGDDTISFLLLPGAPEDMQLFDGLSDYTGFTTWAPTCADVDSASTAHPYSIQVSDEDTGVSMQLVSLAVYDELDFDGDADEGGNFDCRDNCPFVFNSGQANHDSDVFDLDAHYVDEGSQSQVGGDVCDLDDDNDLIADLADDCALGQLGWQSSLTTDWDIDGCQDSGEDGDDDSDTVGDATDRCDPDSGLAASQKDWDSQTGEGTNDYDGDGCRDGFAEETDSDNDNVPDTTDRCDFGSFFLSTSANDHDADGCQDSGEDADDDNDDRPDGSDACDPDSEVSGQSIDWTRTARAKTYDDGCRDQGALGEDLDDDNDGIQDDADLCDPSSGVQSAFFESDESSDFDTDGCQDSGEDTDDDNDGRLDGVDDCSPSGDEPSDLDWISSASTDHDTDGCQDSSEDGDDDNDGELDGDDACARGDLGWISGPGTDYDDDGCRDAGEDLDDDSDGEEDAGDLCLTSSLEFTSTPSTDYDDDGCEDDSEEDLDDDNDARSDESDDCDPDDEADSDLGWTSTPTTDRDSDGCQDGSEDTDDDNDGRLDAMDACDPDSTGVGTGDLDWTADESSDYELDGCQDDGEDTDDDNDLRLDGSDDCDPDSDEGAHVSTIGWDSTLDTLDHDDDGCRDVGEGEEDDDDDNDTRSDEADDCDPESGLQSSVANWVSSSEGGSQRHGHRLRRGRFPGRRRRRRADDDGDSQTRCNGLMRSGERRRRERDGVASPRARRTAYDDDGCRDGGETRTYDTRGRRRRRPLDPTPAPPRRSG